jgi:hypothetical protein
MIFALSVHCSCASDLRKPDIIRTTPTVPINMYRDGDAADVRISMTFGPNVLERFKVWTGEVRGS